MELTSRIPFIVSVIVAFLFMPYYQFSLTVLVATIPYFLITRTNVRLEGLRKWYVALGLLALSLVIYYYYFTLGWVVYASYLFLTLFDWQLAPVLLPLAIASLTQAVIVSPLLGGYPIAVKISTATLPATLLPLPMVALLNGLSSIVGYAIPYALSFAIYYVSRYLPNQLMIKLSLPLFVMIGTGILLNVARVKLRKLVFIRRRK